MRSASYFLLLSYKKSLPCFTFPGGCSKIAKIAIMNDDSSIIGYDIVLSDVIDLLESARRASARTINTIIPATYWKIGRRIVEFEPGGNKKAEYGEQLIVRLSNDLTKRLGRGLGV